MTSRLSIHLKDARRAKQWSQRDLSERAGIPQAHISRIESGAVDPRLSTLLELARTLDLDLVLLPRSALTAVDALVRENAGEAERHKVREIVSRMYATATVLQAMAGGLNDRVADAADSLEQLDLASLPARLRKEVMMAASTVNDAVKARNRQILDTAVGELQTLLTRAEAWNRSDTRPAYSLDEED